MPQCEATTKTPGRANTGKQCLRMAVHGSTVCERHGGVDDSESPAKIRKRLDRPGVRCTASKRDGSPCGAYAIKGARVCRKHGGTLPNVQKAARERMLELVNPALGQLAEIINKPDTSDADRLRAISLVLDRTGHGPKSDVQVEVRKYETVMSEIFRAVPSEADGVFAITKTPPPAALATSQETTGGDLSLQEQEVESTTARPLPGVYRAAKGSSNPPAHLR